MKGVSPYHVLGLSDLCASFFPTFGGLVIPFRFFYLLYFFQVRFYADPGWPNSRLERGGHAGLANGRSMSLLYAASGYAIC
jgi:hypothetical protein